MHSVMQKVKLFTGPKGIDYVLLIPVVLLCAIGFVFIASGTISKGYGTIESHCMWLALGLVALIIGMVTDHSFWRRLNFPLLILGIVLLVIVLNCRTVNGARRWIFIGSLSIQPTEIVKFVLCSYVAIALSTFRKLQDLIKPAIWTLPFLVLIAKEPNFSMDLILLGMIAICVIVANFPTKLLAIGFAIALGVAAIYGFGSSILSEGSSNYRQGRLQSWLNPDENPDKAHQTMQTKIAIGSGGFFGKGIGNGSQKRGFVPVHELHTDSMFSLVAEEGGFVMSAAVMLAFLWIMWRGYVIATRANTKYAKLLAVGLTSLIMLNMLVHIAVCTGRIPNTGQPLPFVSYGGTNLIMNMFFIGVLLNISKERCGTFLKFEEVASEFDGIECEHPTGRWNHV